MVAKKSSLLKRIESFSEAKPDELNEHIEGVKSDTIPSIRDSLKRKEEGAEKARLYKIGGLASSALPRPKEWRGWQHQPQTMARLDVTQRQHRKLGAVAFA